MVSKSFSTQKPFPIPYTKGGITALHANIADFASRATGDLSGLFGTLRHTLISSIAFRRVLAEESKSPTKEGTTDGTFTNIQLEEMSSTPKSTRSSNRTVHHEPPEPFFTTEEVIGRNSVFIKAHIYHHSISSLQFIHGIQYKCKQPH